MARLEQAIEELGLTRDEADGARKYAALIERRRMAGRLAKIYVQIDKDHPGLAPETRHELAYTLFRRQQAEFRRNTLPVQP